jgi:hypothetical protein
MRKLVLVLMMVACGPGVNERVPNEPAPPPGRIEMQIQTQPSTAASKCVFVDRIEMITPALIPLPAGITGEQAINAAVQFLVSGGTDVEIKDLAAGVLVTKQFVGKTIMSTCNVNAYRVLRIRIAKIGGNLHVSMDCEGSMGWEPHDGLQRHREQIQACMDASAGDVAIPALVAEGVMKVLEVSYPVRDPRVPKNPPGGWWCTGTPNRQVTSCSADRGACERLVAGASGEVTECAQRAAASCFAVSVEGAGLLDQCFETDEECRRDERQNTRPLVDHCERR